MTTENSARTNRLLMALTIVAIVAIVAFVAWRQLAVEHQARTEVAHHQIFDQSMDGLFRRNAAYRDSLNHVADDVAGNRLSLPQAVERMSLTEQWSDPLWRRRVSDQFPGQTERASLAASIAQHAMRSTMGSPSESAQLAERLRPQMRTLGAADVSLMGSGGTEPAQPNGGPVGVNVK